MATDLFGTEAAEAALALGVSPGADLHHRRRTEPWRWRAGDWRHGGPADALKRITDAIVAGELTVPIAATFLVDETIRDAVTLQAGRHVQGKIVVKL